MGTVLLIYSQKTSSILPTSKRAAVTKPDSIWVFPLAPEIVDSFFTRAQIQLEGGVTHRLVVRPVSERDRSCEIGVVNTPRQRSELQLWGNSVKKGVMVPHQPHHHLTGISSLQECPSWCMREALRPPGVDHQRHFSRETPVSEFW